MRNPQYVEATQWWKHGDHPDVRELLNTDDIKIVGTAGTLELELPRNRYGILEVSDFIMDGEFYPELIEPGDYITKTKLGRFIVMSKDDFEADYTPAPL
jgi:hypothetical protein